MKASASDEVLFVKSVVMEGGVMSQVAIEGQELWVLRVGLTEIILPMWTTTRILHRSRIVQ